MILMTRRPIEFELFSFVHKVHYSVANFEENNCFFCVDHELINLRMNTVYSKVNYVNPCRAFIFDLESSWLQIVLQKVFFVFVLITKKVEKWRLFKQWYIFEVFCSRLHRIKIYNSIYIPWILDKFGQLISEYIIFLRIKLMIHWI